MGLFDLKGRVAVVTGGNGGIGLGMARGLAQAGAAVAIAGRNVAKSEQAAATLAKLGVKTAVLETDVIDEVACHKMVADTVKQLGRLDILVNNAGINIRKPAHEMTLAEWRQVIDVNLTGVWNCCQIFGAGMVARGGGVIVNIGSMSGEIVNRPQWQPAYNASKAGVHHLTKSLAAEWAPLGVRVNAVAPGYVRTDMTPIDQPEFAARWIGDTPQQRAALPEEIAPAVLFLASPASGFMTGAVLVIDGGYTAF